IQYFRVIEWQFINVLESKDNFSYIDYLINMSKQFSYITHSIQRSHRDSNQARIMIIEQRKYAIYMIFDGVSSYPLSFDFIDCFKEIVHSKLDKLDKHGSNIDDVLFDAHQEVLKLEIEGMTTFSVLRLDFGTKTADFINIG